MAGSRDFDDWTLFDKGMLGYLERYHQGHENEVVFITGVAKSGADAMIIEWCERHGYPWVAFPAKWEDLEAPGAVVRQRRDGTLYNVRAGYARNAEMAQAGTNLIAWWDGVSGGTRDMIAQAERRHLHLFTVLVPQSKKVHHVGKPQGRGGRNFGVRGEAATG